MRNKTQERVEALARERAVTAIDLGLVEEGIEIGKKIMAEVIAAYPNAGQGAAAAPPAPAPTGQDDKQSRNIVDARTRAQVVPAVGNGNGYLNEVSSLNVPHKPGDSRCALIRRLPSPRLRRTSRWGKRECRRTASAAPTTCRCSSTR